MDLRRTLYSTIVLCGGTTLIKGGCLPSPGTKDPCSSGFLPQVFSADVLVLSCLGQWFSNGGKLTPRGYFVGMQAGLGHFLK